MDGRLFAHGKLTVAHRQICCAIKLSDKVAHICCVSDIGLITPAASETCTQLRLASTTTC